MACRQCCRDALELLDGRPGDARDPRALARALRALAGALEGGAALEDRPCERHLLDPLARLGPELFLRGVLPHVLGARGRPGGGGHVARARTAAAPRLFFPARQGGPRELEELFGALVLVSPAWRAAIECSQWFWCSLAEDARHGYGLDVPGAGLTAACQAKRCFLATRQPAWDEAWRCVEVAEPPAAVAAFLPGAVRWAAIDAQWGTGLRPLPPDGTPRWTELERQPEVRVSRRRHVAAPQQVPYNLFAANASAPEPTAVGLRLRPAVLRGFAVWQVGFRRCAAEDDLAATRAQLGVCVSGRDGDGRPVDRLYLVGHRRWDGAAAALPTDALGRPYLDRRHMAPKQFVVGSGPPEEDGAAGITASNPSVRTTRVEGFDVPMLDDWDGGSQRCFVEGTTPSRRPGSAGGTLEVRLDHAAGLVTLGFRCHGGAPEPAFAQPRDDGRRWPPFARFRVGALEGATFHLVAVCQEASAEVSVFDVRESEPGYWLYRTWGRAESEEEFLSRPGRGAAC